MNIAVSCGGTGGHTLPGITVGRELVRRGHDVTLWLGGKSVEKESIRGWSGHVVTVRCAGMPARPGLMSVLRGIGLLRSTLSCLRRMMGRKPDVLLGMGSYTSVGPVLAAGILRVPVVLHEANAVPGRAVSFLSRFAFRVAVTQDITASSLDSERCVVTGFPVRDDILATPGNPLMPGDAVTILVMGGSQGAQAINDVVSDAICRISGQDARLQVIHLSGAADEELVRSRYDGAGVDAKVFAFLGNMSGAYASADLAICRAGAASCAELCELNIPALLIPLPNAPGDHQSANAANLSVSGMADVMQQTEMTVQSVCDYLLRILSNSESLVRMRAAAATMGSMNGTSTLADLVEEAGHTEVRTS